MKAVACVIDQESCRGTSGSLAHDSMELQREGCSGEAKALQGSNNESSREIKLFKGSYIGGDGSWNKSTYKGPGKSLKTFRFCRI